MKKNSANQGSRVRNSVLNAVTGVGGELLIIVLKFVTRTVFIRTLGKAYLGINGLFADILSMLSLAELGVDMAITYQLYKPLAEHDDRRIRILLKFYKQAYRVIGAVILLLGVALIPLLPVLIRDYDSLAALNINAILIFMMFLMRSVSSYWFFAYRSTIMVATQKRYVLSIASYFITIVSNAAQILVLTLYKNFIIYTATVLFFSILTSLVYAVIAKRYYPQYFIKEEGRLGKDEIHGLFKDCGAVFLHRVNGVVLKATDNIVLSSFLGLTMVGLYSNYLLFYTTIQQLLGQVYRSVRASMGNLFVEADISRVFKMFKVMNFITVILFGTAGVGVTVCADELISVWVSDSYVIAQPFALLVGIETYLMGLVNNVYQIRNVSGVFRRMWYRPLVGIVINIVVSVGLVQVIGIYGVIIGTIVTLLTTNIAMDVHVVYKYSFKEYKPEIDYYLTNGLYLLVTAAVCLADRWICSRVYIGHGWLSVIVHVIIVSVSVPAIFVLVFWKTESCQYLIRLLRNFLGKLKKKLHGRSKSTK